MQAEVLFVVNVSKYTPNGGLLLLQIWCNLLPTEKKPMIKTIPVKNRMLSKESMH